MGWVLGWSVFLGGLVDWIAPTSKLVTVYSTDLFRICRCVVVSIGREGLVSLMPRKRLQINLLGIN